MSLTWTHEPTARWDADKARIVGGAAPGIFSLGERAEGALVPGEWWRVDRGGETVGYGWMDVVWAEGEMLLAVASGERGQGVGAFIVEHLVKEASARGLRWVHNKVLTTHPDKEAVSGWLIKRGFQRDTADPERLFKRT